MQIEQLTAFLVPIRLRKPIRHASHERQDNETLIIRCQLTDGSVGWGESLPRVYVTGESTESVWRHLAATDFAQLGDQRWTAPADAARAVDQMRPGDVAADAGVTVRECFGNSVRCALELSVLDSVCRSVGCSLSDLMMQMDEFRSLVQLRDAVYYSGAITSMSPRKQLVSALKMRLFGFAQVKVKVGTAGIDDEACLRRVRRIGGPHVELRLDANESWHCDEVARRVDTLMPFTPVSLEQPVPHAEVSGLSDLRRQLPIPIMLDESLCCLQDAQRAVQGGWCDFFNIRLSKCGGLVRSLQIAKFATQNQIGIQLGCQVGETGILSAAGRHFACTVGGIRFLEGSYDRFLVRETLIRENLTIRRRGYGPRLTGPGLGITVDENQVRRLALRTLQLFP